MSELVTAVSVSSYGLFGREWRVLINQVLQRVREFVKYGMRMKFDGRGREVTERDGAWAGLLGGCK